MNAETPIPSRPAQRWSPRAGGALVESALVLGLFMQIVFGFMEAGRAMYFYNWVSYAAREGTRYACVRGQSSSHSATAADVRTFVINQAVTYDSTNITISTTWVPDNKPGSLVKVKVDYAYHPLTGLFFPSFTMSSSSSMVISQ